MQRLRVHDATAAPRVVLLLGVFLSASLFDTGAVKPFDVPKVSALWVFGWLALALTVVEILRGGLRPVRLRLARVAGLFLLATGISTLFSHTRAVSFFGWYGRYNGFLETLLYVVIFWLTAQLYWRRPERLKEIVAAIGAASAVLVAYLVVQWAGLDPIKWIAPSGQPAFRVFGTLGNADFAGGYIAATAGWLVFAFRRARRPLVRLVVVGWALVTLFALAQTSSRDGLFGVVVAACVAVVVFRRRVSHRVLAAIAGIGVVVLVVGMVAVVSRLPQRTTSAGQAGLLRTNTIVVRGYWWRAALGVFASRPLVGTGPDTFIVEYPRHTRPAAARVFGSERTDEPHNIILERAASLGILGLASYLALLLAAFRWGLRRMRELDGVERDLLGSLLVVLAGYLGQGFFSIDISALALIGWVALGGIAALSDPAIVARARDEAVPRAQGRTAARVAAVPVVIGLAIVGTLGLRPWLADRAAKSAQRDAARTASTEIVLRSYRRAMTLVPYEPTYRGLAGSFLVDQARRIDDKDVDVDLLTQASELAKQMDALQPGNPYWKMSVGSTLAALAAQTNDSSTFEEGDLWLGQAETIAPYDYRAPLQHGLLLNRWGRATHDGLKYCEAITKFNEANDLLEQADAYVGLAEAYGATGHIDAALAAARRARVLNPTSAGVAKLVGRVEKLKERPIKVISCP